MTDDKTMQQHSVGGFLIGVTTGMVQFFLQINSAFGERLVEAALTALVSGACGMLGTYIVSRMIKRKNKSNDKVSNEQ